ncbi:MAG: Transcriptional regulator, TraR/DksA family [Candidatus Gottesmanbacteria bacterium GW2011_GWC2_39_8]|uniref:Transcriptional regulator, TraR/DksA family n=1 Tax=Candidatus Gottesmanbacteria bacterium GW2011_GWC2_39_8 TaxID=1618450 RepID=A0A0G0PWV1_9BACT|nr:MAG: Transcriptional regulator, TraR/DksA family [Candidatus Gottesmanbacteria bacterium GW2011_GWC2_39_8]
MKNSDILNKIKKELEQSKATIQKNLESLKTQDPYINPDRVYDNAASDAEASEESSHERVEALEKELTDRLEALDESLLLINQGKYGLCKKCGKSIPQERLAVYPTALICVECEK